ncbi:MAG: FtsK/SpoIIIE domain-containing protein [Desertimonas sp.]
MEVVVRSRSSEAEVRLETADPEATLADALALPLGRAAPAFVVVDGRRTATASPLHHAGLRRGTVIEVPAGTSHHGVGDARPCPEPTAPVAELVTIAGVGAGRRRPLAPGRYHLGPGAGVHDWDIGTVHDRRRQIVVPHRGSVHERIELDDRVIELRPLPPVAADIVSGSPRPRRHTAVAADGTTTFNRPPRRQPADAAEPITVPDAHRRRDERRSFPLLAMLAPLPIAVGLAYALGSWRFALFGLMAPIMAVANMVEERRSRRREVRRATRADRAAGATLAAEIAERHAEATEDARRIHPDLSELVSWVERTSPRLWERRAGHADAFHIAIGWGDTPWAVPLHRSRSSIDVAEAVATHDRLRGVPVTVDLRNEGGIALVGDRTTARAAARALLLTAAALHGPADLTIVVGSTAGREWEWVKWLPHGPDGRVRVLGDPDADGFDDAVVDPRGTDHPPRRPATPTGPLTLVVADGDEWWQGRAPALRAWLGRDDVRVLALTECEHLVPAACTSVLTWRIGGRAALHHVPSATTIDRVALNQTDPDLTLDTARLLAHLDDPERVDRRGATSIAPAVGLFDLLGITTPSPDVLRRRWRNPRRRARAPLGVDRHGAIEVDLVADGPHALVTGTTGSGKSELLRSLVAGLAATLPPDELNIVLVDFKGGAAFDACALLPHTVGMVSDLDEYLAARMLRSLRAEVTYRERVLRDAAASSLDELCAIAGATALPRLLLVIDEFASLVAQLPAFVPGLVDIAQRGRSLGVHLVLATQRPAGVVDNKIRANTNLRIALRVTDDADSMDVVGTRDAVAIPRHAPGRAVVRFGVGELIELQTALVTAVADPTSATPKVRVRPDVVARPLSSMERRLTATESAATAASDIAPGGRRDLDLLVEAIGVAAGAVELRRPCLDPLPAVVHAEDLPPGPLADRGAIALALIDIPDEQRRAVRTWRPGNGPFALFGIAGSGTTTALLSMALGLAATRSPAETQLYVIDADAGRLGALAPLPHVGAVVALDDTDRLERLVRLLGDEIDRRRQPSPAGGRPAIVVMIDNVASLRHHLDQDRDLAHLWPAIERVVRDGAGVGISGVLTASHERAIPPAMAAQIGERLVLRLADRAAYASFGLRPTEVPDLGPGGAIDPATGHHQQLLAAPDDLDAAVDAIADRWQSVTDGPRRVDPLPPRVHPATLRRHARRHDDTWLLPVGLDRRDGRPLVLSLRIGGSIAVYGPPGSGRSTVVRTLATMAASADPTLVRYGIAPSGGLADLAECPRRPDEVAAWVERVLADERPRVVLVDDADEIDGDSLDRLAGAHRELAVIVSGVAERLRAPTHWCRPLLRTRTGVLVGATAGDGELLRVSVPARRSQAPPLAGHGHAVVEGHLVSVLLASDEPPR